MLPRIYFLRPQTLFLYFLQVFIGDELAAQDLEFVVANKVTHIINCCGRNVPNHWESLGVVYLTYYWVDNENQVGGFLVHKGTSAGC